MSRIGPRNYTPSNLLEDAYYDDDRPHYLYWRNARTPYDAPLHYADTVEIILFRNITCTMHIAGQTYHSNGNACFYIPPNVVHDLCGAQGDGTIYVFHCNFHYLDNYINLRYILEKNGVELQQLNSECTHLFDQIWSCFNQLIDDDANVFSRMHHIITLFEMLASNKKKNNHKDTPTVFESSSATLQTLLDWTERNFHQRITLDMVSKLIHLDKHYLCKWFKKLTGISYHQYLNKIRINRSIEMLRGGCTVSTASDACGFSSTSRYTSLFKKEKGFTPREYISQYRAKIVDTEYDSPKDSVPD